MVCLSLTELSLCLASVHHSRVRVRVSGGGGGGLGLVVVLRGVFVLD